MRATAPARRPAGSTVADVLDATAGPAAVRRVVQEDAPEAARAALAGMAGVAPDLVAVRPVRAVLRPRRKLTVTFAVDVPGDPLAPRPVTGSWSVDAPRDEAPVALEAEARRRQLAAPFRTLSEVDPSAGFRLYVAPLDPAFPQLLRLYDRGYLGRMLHRNGLPELGQGPVPVRYRPGQRHVLRVEGSRGGAGAYLKVYRDETGARAVGRAGALHEALTRWGGPAAVPAARYLPGDRVAVWPEVPGAPLGDVVLARPGLAALAGTVLRVLHAVPTVPDDDAVTSAATECATTARATSHVVALSAAAARRVPRLLAEATARLADLPEEPVVALHGDFKCDNVLVQDQVLHLVDLDRCTAGDPAVDVAKMCSDLRWCAASGGSDPAGLVAAFLDGYGPSPRARLARAACYEALFLARAAGRRVPLVDSAWEDRVQRWLSEAESVLAEGRRW